MHWNKRQLLSLLTLAVALGAVFASAAQAAPKFTALEYPPALITGTHLGSVAFTEEGSITCKKGSYSGKMTEALSTLTLEPKYEECESQGFPVTYFWNGCTYLLHLKEETGKDNFKGNFDFACPAGKVIEAKAYSNPQHTIQLCRMTIGPQTGLLTVTYTNFEAGGVGKEEMVLKVEKIVYNQEGSFCVNGKSENGKLEGTVALEAKDELGFGIDMEITP